MSASAISVVVWVLAFSSWAMAVRMLRLAALERLTRSVRAAIWSVIVSRAHVLAALLQGLALVEAAATDACGNGEQQPCDECAEVLPIGPAPMPRSAAGAPPGCGGGSPGFQCNGRLRGGLAACRIDLGKGRLRGPGSRRLCLPMAKPAVVGMRSATHMRSRGV